jgi:hypothetical protein
LPVVHQPKPALLLGADNEDVYRRVLGLDEESFVALLAAGALE